MHGRLLSKKDKSDKKDKSEKKNTSDKPKSSRTLNPKKIYTDRKERKAEKKQEKLAVQQQLAEQKYQEDKKQREQEQWDRIMPGVLEYMAEHHVELSYTEGQINMIPSSHSSSNSTELPLETSSYSQPPDYIPEIPPELMSSSQPPTYTPSLPTQEINISLPPQDMPPELPPEFLQQPTGKLQSRKPLPIIPPKNTSDAVPSQPTPLLQAETSVVSNASGGLFAEINAQRQKLRHVETTSLETKTKQSNNKQPKPTVNVFSSKDKVEEQKVVVSDTQKLEKKMDTDTLKEKEVDRKSYTGESGSQEEYQDNAHSSEYTIIHEEFPTIKLEDDSLTPTVISNTPPVKPTIQTVTPVVIATPTMATTHQPKVAKNKSSFFCCCGADDSSENEESDLLRNNRIQHI